MILEYKEANIYFETHGKGPAIVLLHGFLENSTMWKEIIPVLSEKNSVISIDLLGHGNSDCLGYIHPMEVLAETVEAVLKKLKIKKYALIGHSMGGYIALALAEKHPENIKGLCLMNSTSNEDSEERKNNRTRANIMAQTNFENMVKMSITNLFYQENLSKFTSEIDFLKQEALKTSLQGYMAAQEGMKIRPNRNHVLTNATFKKLLIFGKNDPVIELKNALEEAHKTNTEFIVLEGGHMSYVESKNLIIGILQNFIKK